MASDITKWADHALILSRHANSLLVALYSVKKQLDLESGGGNDILIRGGLSDLSIHFRGTTITPESPARPPAQRINIFIDPTISGSQKPILKKFPDVGDLGKATPVIQAQSAELVKDLQPYYDLFSAVAEYLDTCIPILLAIQKFKLTMENFPEMSMLYLDVMVALFKVLVLCSQIAPIKKVLLFVYSKAYQQENGNALSNWTSVVNLVKNERPVQLLQTAMGPVASKIVVLLTGLESTIKNRLVSNSTFLKQKGIWMAVPEVYGIQPLELRLESCQRVFEAYTVGMLLTITAENTAGEFFVQVLDWGYVIPLHGDEVFSILGELETIQKEQKVSKLKQMKQDAISNYMQSHTLHRGRREYLVQQLHQFEGSISTKHNAPQFKRVVDVLDTARDEILWYFDHYDKDAYGNIKHGKKEKEQKVIDPKIGELLYLFKNCWQMVGQHKDPIQKQIYRDLVKLFPAISEEIQRQVDDPEVLADSEKQILETLLTGMRDNPIESEYHGYRMSWLRFQLFCNVNGKTSLNRFPQLFELMEPFQQQSVWLDGFESSLIEHSSVKALYYRQSSIHEVIKEVLENQGSGDPHYMVAFGMIAGDFNDNVTERWPYDAQAVNSHTMCYGTEIYSILGQYAAQLAHDLCVNFLQLQKRYKAEPPPVVQEGGKKKVAKRVIQEKSRPGQESNLRDSDTFVTELDEDKTRLRQFLQHLNCGGMTVEDVEFHPFEFFLDSLSTKFRNFLNHGIYVTDIVVTKENYGPGGVDDVMSIDIKRPSQFLHEIKAYLNGATYLNRVTGINVTGVLRDVWADQVDHEKAKRFASGLPGELVFQMAHKVPRDKGKVAQMNTIQPFLITIVQWYAEFLCCKPRSGTTMFSPLHDGFWNTMASSVQSEVFTDPNEMDALCELIGLHGIQFLDEKLSRMVALEAGIMREIGSQNQPTVDKMKKNQIDESQLRELSKKMLYTDEFILSGITAGFICKFRDMMYQSMNRVFSKKFPTVTGLVSSTLEYSGFEQEKPVRLLSNQLGMIEKKDGMLRWALSGLTTDNKDPQLWFLLPYLYANAIWTLTYYPSSKYNPKYDGMTNNAHCLLYGFNKIIPLILNLLELGPKETCQIFEQLWTLNATLLISGWTNFSEPEFIPEAAQSLIMSLQNLAHTSTSLTMEQIHGLFPFGLMKMTFFTDVSHGLAKTAATASRDDDLAL